MTTATRTARATDQQARSIQLASERGETICSWAARFVAEQLDPASGALVSVTYHVESARSDGAYELTYNAAADDALCVCKSARFGNGCWHRGLAIVKGQALAAYYTPAGRAALEAEARDLQRWVDEYSALRPSL